MDGLAGLRYAARPYFILDLRAARWDIWKSDLMHPKETPL
jgi:hypothetical protein